MFLEETCAAMKDSRSPRKARPPRTRKARLRRRGVLARQLDLLDLTPADFEAEGICARTTIINIIAGRREPSRALMERIVKWTRHRVTYASFEAMEAAE